MIYYRELLLLRKPLQGRNPIKSAIVPSKLRIQWSFWKTVPCCWRSDSDYIFFKKEH